MKGTNKNIEELINLKLHLYKLAIKNDVKINEFLNKDFTSIKYYKNRSQIQYVKDVLRSKNTLPLLMEKGNIIGEGFFACIIAYGMNLNNQYFNSSWILEAMSSNISLEEMQECLSILSKFISKEDLKKLFYFCLLDNEAYIKDQSLTYEHFFCLTDLVLNYIKVDSLNKEVDQIIEKLI